ncbi:MAG: HDOD domain-containing protein [Candidatus Marinimicrobia bacterium]|nr:HDOD domain-containing protein [Candidatus Neomarinimicrobiota bacterium]
MSEVKRIIFVDSEKEMLNSIKRVFYPMRKQWTISLFDNADDALKMIETDVVDVLFSDFKLVGMSGLELFDRVRTFSPTTLRIALTGAGYVEPNQKSVKLIHQYLQKPCELKTIKEVIEKADQLQKLLENENLSKIISQVDTLPSLPTIYNEINEKIDLPETSAREIGEIVARDMSMSVKMLQLVNSSFFGLRNKISNPIDAVLMLGLNTVKSLVLSIKIFKKLSEGVDAKMAQNLWNHSLSVGTNNKKIAQIEGLSNKEQYDYFSNGMLLDLGKLFFLAYFPSESKHVVEISKKQKISILQAEKEIFGSTSHHVGAYLMAIWGLPGSLIFSCAFNQDYPKYFDGTFNANISLFFADFFTDKTKNLEQELEKIRDKKFTDKIRLWQHECQDVVKGSNYE